MYPKGGKPKNDPHLITRTEELPPIGKKENVFFSIAQNIGRIMEGNFDLGDWMATEWALRDKYIEYSDRFLNSSDPSAIDKQFRSWTIVLA